MTIKQFDNSMYQEIASWWTGHGCFPVPCESLPPTSAVAFWDDKPIAAAWVYLDNAVGVCLLAWPVARPDACARAKLKALNMVIDYLTKHVKEDLGYSVVISLSSVDSITRLLEHHQFTPVDKGVTATVRKL